LSSAFDAKSDVPNQGSEEHDRNIKDESYVPDIHAELEPGYRQTPYCPGRYEVDTCRTSMPIIIPIFDKDSPSSSPKHYFVSWRIENVIYWKINSIEPANFLSVSELHYIMSPPFQSFVSHAFKVLNASDSVIKETTAEICNYYECANFKQFPLTHELHSLQFIRRFNNEILWNTKPNVLTMPDWFALNATDSYRYINGTLYRLADANDSEYFAVPV
jgi:hypothetical protein